MVLGSMLAAAFDCEGLNPLHPYMRQHLGTNNLLSLVLDEDSIQIKHAVVDSRTVDFLLEKQGLKEILIMSSKHLDDDQLTKLRTRFRKLVTGIRVFGIALDLLMPKEHAVTAKERDLLTVQLSEFTDPGSVNGLWQKID